MNKVTPMYSTTDERGIINNFPRETKMYYAESPANEQKQRYILQGTLAALLVTGLVSMAFVVS
jgi:hypothetical protein